MSKEPKSCRPSETLEQAVKLMWDHDIGSLPVVDDRSRVIGMITDRDVCMAAYLRALPLREISVADVMAREVVTCRAKDADVAVARVMAAHQIHRIPVVDEDMRAIGIVSLNDLALAMARGQTVPPAEVAGTLAAIGEPRQGQPRT